MDDSRFDDFTRIIATSRRAVLKILLSGAAGEVAEKLAGLADDDQLLARSTVRDLVAGSGIRSEPALTVRIAQLDGPASVLRVDRSSLR